MLWLIVTIIAYFLLSLSALGDKYVLSGPPNPKNYTFYNGILGILILLIAPFVGFSFPNLFIILIALFAGAIFVLANYCYFFALEHFDVSRVSPAIGAMLPIFTFIFVFVSSADKTFLSTQQLIAFCLLILGSVTITLRSVKQLSFRSLGVTALAALLFAIDFLLSKYIYAHAHFWSGLILMRVGSFLAAAMFVFSKSVRDEIFRKVRPTFQLKTGIVYAIAQITGAGGYVMQSWAVALVPLAFLPFINALEGIKYVFLLLFVLIFGNFLPKGLQEESSKRITIQKVVSILIICAGLALLSLK